MNESDIGRMHVQYTCIILSWNLVTVKAVPKSFPSLLLPLVSTVFYLLWRGLNKPVEILFICLMRRSYILSGFVICKWLDSRYTLQQKNETYRHIYCLMQLLTVCPTNSEDSRSPLWNTSAALVFQLLKHCWLCRFRIFSPYLSLNCQAGLRPISAYIGWEASPVYHRADTHRITPTGNLKFSVHQTNYEMVGMYVRRIGMQLVSICLVTKLLPAIRVKPTVGVYLNGSTCIGQPSFITLLLTRVEQRSEVVWL